MNIRRSVSALGFAVAFAAPAVALADVVWETTNDEAGSRIVTPQLGSAPAGRAITATAPLSIGALSPDRQFVYLGAEGGWQLRPMEYRFEEGRLVHVDDPVGHMHRLADSSAPTVAQRAALERGGA